VSKIQKADFDGGNCEHIETVVGNDMPNKKLGLDRT
jgi:hypothetical protein